MLLSARTTMRCCWSCANRPEAAATTIFFRLRELPWYSGNNTDTSVTSIRALPAMASDPERDAAARPDKERPGDRTKNRAVADRANPGQPRDMAAQQGAANDFQQV